MLEIIKQFVRRMLMGKGKGILQIAPKKDVDKFAADLFKKFKQNGVPDEAVTNPNDVKVIWNQITNKEIKPLTDQLKKQLERLKPKKSGDVFDLTGKKIDTSKPILGGKNVPETEEQILERLNRQNKESVERLKKKREKEIMDDMKEFEDPEDFAHGGRTGSGLNYLLGEDDQNSRVPFKDGTKFDPKRRTVLKGIAALATLPIIGKYFKWAKPLAKSSKVLTSVPINNISGMPAWFKPLVNKVIKEGDDVTKKFATQDREIVHQVSIEGKIGKDALGVEDVRVTQNLDEGTIRVEYNSPNTIGESGVDLLYKKGEVIPTKKGSVKTKDEFTASEDDFYPQQTSPDDFDIEFTENIVKNVDDLYSDTSKLKEFATGKKLTIKEISESMKKKNILKEIDKNPNEHAFRNVPDEPPYDYASGGRVPLAGGKGVMSLIQMLNKKFGKDTAKKASQLGKPESVLTREMFQNFNRKLNTPKIWEDETKVRAAVDDIFPSGDYKMDAEMAAESLVENNPAAFGGKLIDDIDDATRSEIYGAVLRVVQSDLGKRLQLKKLSKPTKTLEGIEKTGTINISDAGVADEFTRFMKETDPKGHRKIEEIVEITNFDPKGKKGHAEGGRVPMIYGGTPGLKAMWKEILQRLSKSKGKKISKFFPKMDQEMKVLTNLGEKLDPTAFKAFNTREKNLKLEGVEHIIERLKQDKEWIKQLAANKAMKDEGLDFLMKHMEESDMIPKYLHKYTDIDKDILTLETIKKNLIMKDRKLNATGGLARMLGE